MSTQPNLMSTNVFSDDDSLNKRAIATPPEECQDPPKVSQKNKALEIEPQRPSQTNKELVILQAPINLCIIVVTRSKAAWATEGVSKWPMLTTLP